MKYNNIIPWAKPKIFSNEKINLNKALSSLWISGGSYLNKFESQISKKLNAKYVSCVSNGTSALHAAFLSLNLKRNDEIIIPGFGYLAAANISYLMGLKIKFVDVDIENFCLSYDHLKRSISSKTKAVIFIHTYGNSGDVKKISEFLKKKKIYLVEDAAEAFGTKNYNKSVGTFGDLGTFSFHATKNITTGEGGCIVTNNKKIYENINLYKSHGVKNKRYYHIVAGHNFRLTNLQAAIGYSQMQHVDKIIKKRKILYNEYLKLFYKVRNHNFSFQKINKSTNFVPWTLAINLKNSSEKKRDRIISKMMKKGIETRNGFCFPKKLKMYKNIKNLSNSLDLSNQIICLPIFYDLTKKNINKIVHAFYTALKN